METKNLPFLSAQEVQWKKQNRLEAAAPDLLSALQGVVDAYGCECLDTEPQSHCPMCIAREAIAKAEGNQ